MVVSQQDFRQAFSSVAASVAVVTTNGDKGLAGLTVTSYASVSDAPPTVLVCVGKGSASLPAILENGKFCLNLLSLGQEEISDIFAGRRGHSSREKFEHVDWHEGSFGMPRINNVMCALECQIVEKLDVASHSILVGEVHSILEGVGQPLIYHARRYARLTGA